MGEFNNYSYASPRSCHSNETFRMPAAQPVLSREAWQQRLAEVDESHQVDIRNAISEAAELGADVHLHRKIGSQFLGIALKLSEGPRVKVWEYPEIRA